MFARTPRQSAGEFYEPKRRRGLGGLRDPKSAAALRSFLPALCRGVAQVHVGLDARAASSQDALPTQRMNPKIKWAAQLSHVREVSLRGGADLTYWKDRLASEGLLPLDRDGRA